jgi:ubiquinone/menaquinone biosynthesis C-methylase UbiE
MDKEYEKIRQYRIRKCRAELSSMRTRLGFEKSAMVLEIGAGDGEEILWWVASGSNCTAIEIAAETCKAIMEKLKKKNMHPHADIVRASGEYLPFRENVFDLVFAKAVLHHIGKPLQAISEMRRVARILGIVAAIDDPNALNPFWNIAKIITESKLLKKILSPFFSGYYWEWDASQHPFEDWATPFYPWQMQQLFKKANLQQTKVSNLWQPYYIKWKWFFKAYLLSEKTLEKTPIPYILGQLFVVGRK